ncbi:MAG TPA: DNA-binding domain-containing protein [Beijerinckia sp.]|jgi:hypothetical protein|nr:DNA-binding domain-containing protein [Beijerinckia sp.]
MFKDLQCDFAEALRDPSKPLPMGLVSQNSHGLEQRFAVYRNNVAIGLIEALEARFPVVRRLVGEEFFTAMARVFVQAHPPRSPLLMIYGDSFPQFIAGFGPAAELIYLADIARLEAARTRAYHAADAQAFDPSALAGMSDEALQTVRFMLHPAVEIISSAHPIVTIWAMNSDEKALGPIKDWRGEDALISRPGLDVEVHCLPEGAAVFLQSLASGLPLGEAVQRAIASSADFDLAKNLAALFGSGLAINYLKDSSEEDA